MSDEEKKHDEEAPDFSKIIVGLVVAVVVLGGIVYASYSLTQKKGGVTFPAGFKQPNAQTPGAQQGTTLASVDCAIAKPNLDNVWAYYIKCEPYKTSSNTSWEKYENSAMGFELDLPADFDTIEYPNGMGLNYKEIQAAANLLYAKDFASTRSGEFKEMKGDNYVKNYWRQFSGLTGLKSYEAITNKENIKGHKAQYLNFANESPNTDVFFEYPSVPGDFIHLSSGILDKTVFDKVIDSFKWDTKKK